MREWRSCDQFSNQPCYARPASAILNGEEHGVFEDAIVVAGIMKLLKATFMTFDHELIFHPIDERLHHV